MTNPLKNDKIGEIFDYQIFKEGIVSYFEQFMQANQAYVALHGQLNLPLKPKTRVAIVTGINIGPSEDTGEGGGESGPAAEDRGMAAPSDIDGETLKMLMVKSKKHHQLCKNLGSRN